MRQIFLLVALLMPAGASADQPATPDPAPPTTTETPVPTSDETAGDKGTLRGFFDWLKENSEPPTLQGDGSRGGDGGGGGGHN